LFSPAWQSEQRLDCLPVMDSRISECRLALALFIMFQLLLSFAAAPNRTITGPMTE
jgi:hypothetical protein